MHVSTDSYFEKGMHAITYVYIHIRTHPQQTIPLEKIEDFGVHANQYYQLDVSFFKSSLDSHLLVRISIPPWSVIPNVHGHAHWLTLSSFDRFVYYVHMHMHECIFLLSSKLLHMCTQRYKFLCSSLGSDLRLALIFPWELCSFLRHSRHSWRNPLLSLIYVYTHTERKECE